MVYTIVLMVEVDSLHENAAVELIGDILKQYKLKHRVRAVLYGSLEKTKYWM